MPEAEQDTPTQLLPLVRPAEPAPEPVPVFVDASGRRRRVAHRLAVGAFVGAAAYSLLVIWSLLGGPVSPDTLMPFSAPHPSSPAVHTVQPTGAAPDGASAGASALPGASPSGAAQGTSTAGTSASGAPSSTASASPTGHRSTRAAGKPGRSATPGHGH